MSIILAFINASTGVILISVDMEAVRDRETDVGGDRRERRFKLRGGVVCLDFVNTVGSRLTDRPSEYLRSYEDLLDWGRALALREVIHRMISRAIAGESQDESDLSALNRELSIALSHLRVTPADGAYGWVWDRSGDDGGMRLDSPLWPVAQSAAELLTSPKLGRVKLCAGEGCGWVFLDESRNGSRRWCDSRDCGNRERVRRHLARKRAFDQ
jgi:predicted RNA-binding Zn ribbon-like protein